MNNAIPTAVRDFTARPSTVRFYWDGKTRVGLVRNGVVRHVEPAIDANDVNHHDPVNQYDMPSSLQDAVRAQPDLFEELKRDAGAWLAPYPVDLRPDHVARCLYKGKWTLLALGTDIVLNACDQATGTAFDAKDVDRLQAAYDACPRMFLKMPLAGLDLSAKHAVDANKASSVPLRPVHALYYKTLCLAADSPEHDAWYDISHVQADLPVRFRVIKETGMDYTYAKSQFPRFK